MENRYFTFICKLLKKILLVNLFPRWGSYLAEQLNLHHIELKDDYSYKYLSINPLLYWRAETLFEKEPITIAWLRSIKKGEILYDIGANVGVYTIYAGVRGAQVFSFEPESSNYYILNKNIQLNQIQKNVRAYNFALSNLQEIDALKLTSSQAGAAHTTLGDNEQYKQNNLATIFEQGIIALTLDQIIFDFHLPIPHHIKIDVDGIEAKIIEGSTRLLAEKQLQSIIIELNESSPEDQKIVLTLKNHGFVITEKSEPIVLADQKGVLRECIFRRN